MQSVEHLIVRLQAGDQQARAQLLEVAGERLMRLTRTIKQDFGPRVGRWEQTEDVFQAAALRLYRELEQVELKDAGHFFALAARAIRRQLIELARKYQGPRGLGRHHVSQPAEGHAASDWGTGYVFDPAELTHNPDSIAEWSEFHRLIEQLPPEQRQVVDLLYYHGLSQQQAAGVLNVDERTVRRRWRDARITLSEALGCELPGAESP